MSRVFAYPLLWLALLAMWLLLNESVAPSHILLGAVVALVACWAVAALQPAQPRIRRPLVILMLLALVIDDVIRSNLTVLGQIITGRELRSRFLTIPLTLDDPNGLVVLACIITATPGSAWIDYDSARSTVMVHVLHVTDDAAWAATIKRKYESRLLEIFR